MSEQHARIEQQLRFVIEIDALKQVLRQTSIMGESRRENSAEHSWHLAVMALALAEHAGGPIDVLRVLKMLLVHDIVEIDAGDTFCYDAQANLSKAEREQAAAARIFGLLPSDTGAELSALWEEFELAESFDARFANALDRLEPLLHNYHNKGGSWRNHGIKRPAVMQRMAPIATGLPALWPYVLEMLDQACAEGFLAA